VDRVRVGGIDDEVEGRRCLGRLTRSTRYRYLNVLGYSGVTVLSLESLVGGVSASPGPLSSSVG